MTPNTGFYVGLQGHQQAMEVLQTALNHGEGFIKVTGEVGTGKTLLCRKLLNEAPAHWSLAYIPDPNLDPQQLRQADIAAQLGLVEQDYAWITSRIVDVARRHAGGRIVSCLEGGYVMSALSRSAEAHIRVLADV